MKTRWLGWCAVYILWLGACTSGPTAPASTVTPTALVPAPSQTPVPVTSTPSTEPIPLEQTNAALQVQPLTALSYFGTVPDSLDRAVVVYTDAAGRVLSQQEVPANDGTIAFTIITGGALGPATITIMSGAQIIAGPTIVHSVVADSTLQTDVPVYSDLFTQTTAFLGQSARAYELNGTTVRGYRSPDNPLFWLRDHVYQGRGFRYIEQDVKSLLTAFAAAQLPDGSLPDWIDAPEMGVKAGRKDVEADVEFLFVQGIYEAWQMSGDDAWMTQMLPHARAALTYTTSDAVRWDATRGLIRRPYTIDMWDFSYGPTTNNPETGNAAPRHWIDDQTIWGTFHGDNTGLVQALRMMAAMEQRGGTEAAARGYQQQASEIQQRIIDLSWNGRFFRHFVAERPDWKAPGVDESTQLSLSNAYALNRGVLSAAMIQQVLDTYYERGRSNGGIGLPWYSIDPPFPAGSYGLAGRKGELPGEYVNGGLLPLVGGELARSAFGNNLEAFGFDTLNHYAVLINRFGGSYLWYYPTGQPGISGPDTLAVDGWGSSAMLGALMEGAAGIVDTGFAYKAAKITPRWGFSPVRQAYVVARYPASQAYVAYRWQQSARRIEMHTTGTATFATVNIPIPDETPDTATLTIDGVVQQTNGIAVVRGRRMISIKITENTDLRGLHHLFVVEW